MNKAAKIGFLSACLLILVSACNDKTSSSPYAEILAQPPYASLTDSIKRDKNNDGLYFRRAVLLNSNNLPEPALADFEKAWSLKKEEPYALGIGTLLLEKKPDSAIAFLQQALTEIPNSLLLRLNLARAYVSLDKKDDALRICDDILQHNPQQVDVLKLKADLLAKQGRSAESLQVLEAAYRITPYDVELNYVLALKYAEGKNPRVLALCDSLIRADSLDQHAEPYYYKGIYYSNLNDFDRALVLFDAAISHDYQFLDAYIEKAAVRYNQKKYTEALNVLERVLTISPRFADAYYWTGKCQEAAGDKESARLNYLRAFSLDKEMMEAKEAADRTK